MSTATVLELHGRRAVEVDRLPVERRKDLLRWLARHTLEVPPEAAEALLSAWCRDRADLEDRWLDFCERLALADAADQGVLDWRQVSDDLTCTERTETAREIARQDADAALAVLIGSAR